MKQSRYIAEILDGFEMIDFNSVTTLSNGEVIRKISSGENIDGEFLTKIS